MKRLRKFIDLRPQEWSGFVLFFVIFLAFNLSMAWLGTVAKAMLVVQFGLEFFAFAFVVYGSLSFGLGLLHSIYSERIDKRLLFLIMLLMSLLAFVLALLMRYLPTLNALAALSLFVLSKLILLLCLLQWKDYLLEFYDSRASKRILPVLETARLLGTGLGGLSLLLFVGLLAWLQVEAFLYASLLALLFCFLLVEFAPRHLPAALPLVPRPRPRDSYVERLRTGFVYINDSPYLKWLALSAFLMHAQITLFEYIAPLLAHNYYLQQGLDLPAQTRSLILFFAQIDTIGALLLLFIQVRIFPRLFKRLGLGNMNLIYPVFSFGIATFVLLNLAGTIGQGFRLLSATAAHWDSDLFRRSFRSSIKSLLLNTVPSYMQGRGRTVITVLLAPLAPLLVGAFLLINQLTLFGRDLSRTLLFIGLTLCVSLAYMLVSFILKREYRRSIQDLINAEDYAALLNQDHEIGAADTASLAALWQKIQSSADSETQLFIAAVMLEVGGKQAVPYLLQFAQSAPPEIQARLLESFIEVDLRGTALRDVYSHYHQAENVNLRRLAVQGIMQISQAQDALYQHIVSEHSHDADPQIRAVMARALLLSADRAQEDKGSRILKAMQSDFEPQARIEAIHTMVAVNQMEAIRQLVWMLEDKDDSVRLEATRAIAALWRGDMLSDLTQLILEREALFLDDPVESIRRAELEILGKIGNANAAKTLVRALADSSAIIREAASNALVQIGLPAMPSLLEAHESADLHLQRQIISTLTRIQPTVYRDDLEDFLYYTLLMIYQNHAMCAVFMPCKYYPSFDVLRLNFLEDNQRLLTEAFAIMRILYGETTIQRIYAQVQSENPRHRMQGIDDLAALAHPQIAQLLAPLIEPLSNSASLAEAYYEQSQLAPYDINKVLRDLASSKSAWLRSVTVLALAEAAADNPDLRQTLLTDVALPKVSEDLAECQRALDPKLAAITIRTAHASHEADVKRSARAAMRYIRQESVFDVLAEQGADEAVLSIIERMIYLKRVPFFQSVAIEQLKALAGICEEEVFKAGQALFYQGDTGASLYIVVTGKIQIGLRSRHGSQFTILAEYGVNTVFGEMSLFDGQARSADALAAVDTMLLSLRREAFLALMRQYPDLSSHIITLLSDRLRHANEQILRLNGTS